MTRRPCLDCRADISHRGHAAKRCEPCAATAIATASRRGAREWRKRNPSYAPPTAAPELRTCLDCPADISHRNHRAKRCEGCQETARKATRPVVSKRYRETHPGSGTEDSRRWRAANRERHTTTARQYREATREQRACYMRAYRRRMRTQRRVYDREWRAANPEAARRYRHEQRENRRDAQHRRRARQAALPWEPIIYRYLAVRDHWACGLCHEPVNPTLVYPDPMSGSVDHVVPISKGGAHTYGNVQLAHLTCNLAKGDRAR